MSSGSRNVTYGNKAGEIEKKGAVIVSNRKKEEVTNLVFPKGGILLL